MSGFLYGYNPFAEDAIPCEGCGDIFCDGWCDAAIALLEPEDLMIATETGVLN